MSENGRAFPLGEERQPVVLCYGVAIVPPESNAGDREMGQHFLSSRVEELIGLRRWTLEEMRLFAPSRSDNKNLYWCLWTKGAVYQDRVDYTFFQHRTR